MKQKRARKHSGKLEVPANPTGRIRADKADPQGSYTGRPANPRETPVQDADDL